MSFQDPIALLLGDWAIGINLGSIILRMMLSIILSALIGIERAEKRHTAGLRTFMTISSFFTVAMLLDINSGTGLYIISGCSIIAIAILGSNSLLFSSRNQLQGLTTSVALFSAGIIGLTSGAGLYVLTLASFIALYAILDFLPKVESRLREKSKHFELHIELKNSLLLQDFVLTIRKLGLHIDNLEPNTAYLNTGLAVYTVAISIVGNESEYKNHCDVIKALSTLDFISYIEEMEK